MKGRDAVVNHSLIDVYPAGDIKQYTISIVVGYRKTIYARRSMTTPKIDAMDRGTIITKEKVFYVNIFIYMYFLLKNMLNLKTAEVFMPILHSRPSKSYRTKNNAISIGDSLCFGNSLGIKK